MVTNAELHIKLYVWLTSNQILSYSIHIKRLSSEPKIHIFDNKKNMNVSLDCKDYIKYLRILSDDNLS